VHTMQSAILPACLLLTPALGRAEHNPLLPRPQQIRYGSGQLRVQDLSIRFASGPTAEDRFAADELASALRARAESPITVVEGWPSGRAIVLRRTGSGPDLPQPDERPGPDSREAYTIKVNLEGAEIGARSSVGQFHGVQTLGQMVEGSGSETLGSRKLAGYKRPLYPFPSPGQLQTQPLAPSSRHQAAGRIGACLETFCADSISTGLVAGVESQRLAAPLGFQFC
jgi:hypothetical protein